MTFWIITVLLAVISVAILALALMRGGKGAEPAAAYDLKVYRDQLSEVERDLARGVIDPADAERLRNEISRRVLAADAAMQSEVAGERTAGRMGWVLSALVAVVLIGGSVGIYLGLGAPGYGDLGLKTRLALAEEAYANRPSQERAEAALPPPVPNEELSEEYQTLVNRLRDTVAERPDDLQGHILLAENEFRLGNFAAAYAAQEQVLRLKGAEAVGHDFALMATMMTLAAGEYVSPEAEVFLREAMAREPANPLARYHVGLMMLQTGRPDQAFHMWERLLREGPEHAPWVRTIRGRIEDVAWRAGVNYELPAPAVPQGAALGGPSAEDIEAAQDMSAEDRMSMIRGMVDGLMDRLATEGGSPEEWARLIGALGVLGEQDKAREIHAEARQVFASSAEAVAMVDAAARQAGVLE